MLMLLSGCTAIPYSCQAATHPAPRPAQHIYVGEDYHTRFDARPGDTITLIMTPDSTEAMLTRCDHAGGELIANPYTDIWSCDDVDF